MDLHFTGAQPTPAERAAVDSVLGEELDREDKEWFAQSSDGITFGENQFPIQRHRLLPVLHAIQAQIGWISPGAVNHAGLRLDIPPAEVYGVASFYEMFSLSPRPAVVAHVCDDIACITRGAEVLCGELEKKLGPAGSPCSAGRATWQRSACLGLCERAPAAMVTLSGKHPQERVLAPAKADDLVSLVAAAVEGRLPGQPDSLSTQLSVPQAGSPVLRLLRRVGNAHPLSLEDYQRHGGYEAL